MIRWKQVFLGILVLGTITGWLFIARAAQASGYSSTLISIYSAPTSTFAASPTALPPTVNATATVAASLTATATTTTTFLLSHPFSDPTVAAAIIIGTVTLLGAGSALFGVI